MNRRPGARLFPAGAVWVWSRVARDREREREREGERAEGSTGRKSVYLGDGRSSSAALAMPFPMAHRVLALPR
jgi:hypothetical protein